jgi:hypothetical protein
MHIHLWKAENNVAIEESSDARRIQTHLKKQTLMDVGFKPILITG